MSKLYIVATPIGNLKDITLRALDILREVDFIASEDTRVTRKLLTHYKISRPLISYHEHSKRNKYDKIAKMLSDGNDIALLTDAGTPGISDPGARLIDFIRRELPDVCIIAIPGPSALTAAISLAGINMDKFLFLGFPPHKKGRKTFFEVIRDSEVPVVFYESTHRIEKAFQNLEDAMGVDRDIIVARELTKIYEEVWRGSVCEAKEYFQNEKKKGEFVVIVPKNKKSR